MFSSLDDKIDHCKLLKSEGYSVKIVSDGKGHSSNYVLMLLQEY